MFLILALTQTPSPTENPAASFDWFEPLSLLIGVLVGGVITYGVNLLTQRKMERRQSAKRRKARIYTPLRQELIRLLDWRLKPEKTRTFAHIDTEPPTGRFMLRGYQFLLWNEMKVDGRALASCSPSARQAMHYVFEAIKIFNDQLAGTRDIIQRRTQHFYKEAGGQDIHDWDYLITPLILRRLEIETLPYSQGMKLSDSERQRLGYELAQRLLDDGEIKATAARMLDADERLKDAANKAVHVLEDAMQHISKKYEHERITE